jgi:hypothetical protein
MLLGDRSTETRAKLLIWLDLLFKLATYISLDELSLVEMSRLLLTT